MLLQAQPARDGGLPMSAFTCNSFVSETGHQEGPYSVAEDLVRPLMEELLKAVKRIRSEWNLRNSEITSPRPARLLITNQQEHLAETVPAFQYPERIRHAGRDD